MTFWRAHPCRVSFAKWPRGVVPRLSQAAEFLGDQATIDMAEVAPEGYETLVRYYDRYARACARTVEAIEAFLHGVGDAVAIERAHDLLKAENDGRDIYLESIDFPACL